MELQNPHNRPLDNLLKERARLDAEIEELRPLKCVAFIDMVGSTLYTDRHGDIEGKLRVNTAGQTVVPLTTYHNGSLVKELGDGWLVMFDDANDAIQASAEIQREIFQTQSAESEPIELKIGIDYGRILVESGDIYGDVVNKCSKLTDVCSGGSILLTQPVFTNLDPFYQDRCFPLSEVVIRGAAKSASVYEVLWGVEEFESVAPDGETLVLDIQWDKDEIRINLRGQPEDSQALIPYESKQIDSEELDRTSERILKLLSDSSLHGSNQESVSQLEDLGKKFFEAVFPPQIAHRIRTCTHEYLLFILDAPCVHLPWELAHDGSEYLCCRFGVGRKARTPQATSGLKRESPRNEVKFLVLANPTGDLSAATNEGTNLLHTYSKDQRVWLEYLNGPGVSTQSLLNRLSEFDILHFCGHAEYFPEDPDNSRWLLADGCFAARDLEAFSRNSRPGPLLVFGNACQSGSTDAWTEKPVGWSYGLANAFLLAGATHYIGTVAELLDASGKDFAQTFYRSIIAGFSVGRSLKCARLELRRNQGAENLSWAQYVLYGNPALGIFAKVKHSSHHPALEVSRPTEKVQEHSRAETRSGVPVAAASKGTSRLSRYGGIGLAVAAILIALGALFFTIRGNREEEGRKLLSLAESSYRNADYTEALRNLERLQHLGGLTTPLEASGLRLQADIAYAQGDTAKAAALYEQAAGIDSEDARALSGWGLIRYEEGDLDSALALVERAARQAPQDPIIVGLWERYKKEAQHRQEKEWWDETETLIEEVEGRLKERENDPPPDPWTSRPFGMYFSPVEILGSPNFRPEAPQALVKDLGDLISRSDRWFMVDRERLDAILKSTGLSLSSVSDPRYREIFGRYLGARGLVNLSIDRREGKTLARVDVSDIHTTRISPAVTASTTGDLWVMAEELFQEMAQVLRQDYKIQGRIRSATGSILLNVGALHGVVMGQTFDVFLPNPDNPESVTGQTPLGILEVVEVGREDAACQLIEGATIDLEVGLRVREKKG